MHRDHHTCQNSVCKNKDQLSILQVDHIVYQSNGEQIPKVTLSRCVRNAIPLLINKKGKFLYGWQTNKPKMRGFSDTMFMSIVKRRLTDIEVAEPTYRYITKHARIELKLDKDTC